jgi:hypothetical protein
MFDITPITRKRCRQMDRCDVILSNIRDNLSSGCDPSCIARGLRRLKRYLDGVFPDTKERAAVAAIRKERDEMLDAIVRINNWCCQDLAENTYVSEPSGNYEKTLHGLCDICRPYVATASKLKRYGGTE